MAINWQDLVGTISDYFRVGKTGPRLKNNSGALAVRNAADSADANVSVGTLTAADVQVTGNSITINSDGTGTGGDYKIIIQKSGSQTQDVTYTLPVDDGTPGQVLQTDGNGVLTWVSAGSTAACDTEDTTTLAFGSTSPVAAFTLPANAVVLRVKVIIDTAFNGTPTMSVGISGTTSKYMGSGDVDLTAAAGTGFQVAPNVTPNGSSENIIITYSAGSATAGSARVIVAYAVPA